MLAALLLAAVLQENVASRTDPAQTYTLFLPSSYDAAKKHPLLFVFDPRGRATMAAELFRAGAEEHGWIIVSLNGTRSDSDAKPDPNEQALRAVVPHAIERYAVDPNRVYAAGFSGTAVLAWNLGIVSEMFAGVIGVGGPIAGGVPPEKFNFAHYGFAGDADFNNLEMRRIDAQIGAVPHRLQTFPGEHRWMPAELAREAIAWFELIAMKENRRARDEAFIRAAYSRELAAAAASSGLDALRRYRDIVATFDDLHPIDDAKAAVARLEKDETVRRELEEEKTWDAFEERFGRETFPRIGKIAASLRAEEPVHAAKIKARFLRELRVAELKRRATREGAEGRAARRILASIHVQMAFYLPRKFEERGETAFAEGVRAVAAEIRK
jgi:dienelactone hydrolase